jgi:hypothetical protein
MDFGKCKINHDSHSFHEEVLCKFDKLSITTDELQSGDTCKTYEPPGIDHYFTGLTSTIPLPWKPRKTQNHA